MPTPQRLPFVNGDDGQWGDIILQWLKKEHYDDGTDNAVNGGHKTITVRAGTTSAGTAPIKLTSGSLMTSPEAGAMEFLTDKLYFTSTTGPTRKTVAIYDDSSGATGDIYYRNSSGNFTRLGIGSSTNVLTVSGGLPAWSAAGGGSTTFADDTFAIQDNVTPSKQLQFQLSNISTSTTRTITMPDASGTVTLLGNTSTGSDSVVLATSPTIDTLTTSGTTTIGRQNPGDGTSTAGNTNISTTSSFFTAGDVGRNIFAWGITTGTTIATQSGTSATTSANTVLGQTSATFSIGGLSGPIISSPNAFLIDRLPSNVDNVINATGSFAVSNTGLRGYGVVGANFVLQRANGTPSAGSPVNSGEVLGSLNFSGATSTAANPATYTGATIQGLTTETYSGSAGGSKIIFTTTPNGSHTGATVFTLDQDASATFVGKVTARIQPRVTTITSSATPTINTDNCDAVTITAQAAAITSMTTNLSGTPSNFDRLTIRIKDNGTARAITWGASFAARGAVLPTTTVISKVLYVQFIYNTVTSTWDCVAVSQES